MSKKKTPDSITHTGITFGFLVSIKQKQMLKELAEREDSSMNRLIRRWIENEYTRQVNTAESSLNEGKKMGSNDD